MTIDLFIIAISLLFGTAMLVIMVIGVVTIGFLSYHLIMYTRDKWLR